LFACTVCGLTAMFAVKAALDALQLRSNLSKLRGIRFLMASAFAGAVVLNVCHMADTSVAQSIDAPTTD
jgi:hypothetical protein